MQSDKHWLHCDVDEFAKGLQGMSPSELGALRMVFGHALQDVQRQLLEGEATKRDASWEARAKRARRWINRKLCMIKVALYRSYGERSGCTERVDQVEKALHAACAILEALEAEHGRELFDQVDMLHTKSHVVQVARAIGALDRSDA